MSDDKGTDKHADDPARTSNSAADAKASGQQERPAVPAEKSDTSAATGATGSAQSAQQGTGSADSAATTPSAGAGAPDTTKQTGQSGPTGQNAPRADQPRGRNKHKGKNKNKNGNKGNQDKNAAGQAASGQQANQQNRPSKAQSASRQPAPATTQASRQPDSAPAAGHKQAQAASPAAREQRSDGAARGHSGDSGGRSGASGGGRSAIIVAVIALVIAIIAMLGAAWVWQSDMQRMVGINNRMATLQNDVATDVRKRVESDVQSSIKPTLSQLKSRLGELASASKQQGKAAKQQDKSVKQLRQQLNTTRTQLADMSQRLQGSTRRWQLNEIEHLLITANRRLQLYQAPDQARQALSLASQSIARINDPRLFDVRKEIIDEMAALDALPSPDIDGMAMTLTAFIKRVPDLPLASDVPDNFKPDRTADDRLADDGIDFNAGWQHFVDSVGTALKSMATLRRTDGTQPALLPADQVYFLTQNLTLELRSARLALLQGNSTQYRASLPTAIQWLKKYFDTDENSVSSMIEQLGQMTNVKLDWQAPDISASLVSLRKYMQKRSNKAHDADRKQADEAAQNAQPSATDQDDNSDAAQQGNQ